MLLFPMFVVRGLKQPGVWFTTAPALLILVPLFHATMLAYLGIRSVFFGMSLAGTDSPTALAAGLGEAHAMLLVGAMFSAIVLITVVGLAMLYVRRGATNSICITTGRITSAIATTVGLILIAGVFALSFTVPAVSGAERFQLFRVVTLGAATSGALVILSVAMAFRFIIRSAGQNESSISHRTPLWTAFAPDFVIIVVTGAASWLAEQWFNRIAMAGA